ncbi:MAG: tannase/feruloyl esterase family alpha/beta hydrolase [Novosphingobium sp.]
MRSKLLMMATAGAIALGTSATASAANAPAAAPSEQCDTATMQAMAPPGTTVAFAARDYSGCRVNGYVTTQNPGPNKVLFVLALPNNFNGRYLYLGVGGAAGLLPTMTPELLRKGYAVSGSDGGSGAKNGADFSFKSDPARLADFMGRGVRVTAAATQAITRSYYGRPQIRRYISGCSGGGQMGLGNARRNGGEDFDGFIVGATPLPNSAFKAHVFTIVRHLQNHPEGWISPELMKQARAAILAAYDTSDGAADGIISDQRNIARFDPAVLAKVGFTPAQIATFNLISTPHTYKGPGLHGAVVHPGFPITDVGSWSGFLLGSTPPPWKGTNQMPTADLQRIGAPFFHIMADTNARSMTPSLDYWKSNDTELVRIATRNGEDNPMDDPMDFGALAKSGSKMIIFHGVNDQAMGYLETMDAYAALTRRFADSANWVRAYAVPGMLHCAGGPGPTDLDEHLLDSLVAWVEKGEAPRTLVANRFSQMKGLERSFLLCPEPTHAKLKAAGLDADRAENWACS